MSFFDKLKNLASSELEEDKSIVMRQMDIVFEEAVSKAEAFEKLGRKEDAVRKFREAASKLSDILKTSSKNYIYVLKVGELYMKLGYTKDKIFFQAAEPYYRMIIDNFGHDPDADLTMTYWRLGILEERIRNNQEKALAYYDLAIRAPKGRKITDYQKKYDLSAVYLSLAILYSATNEPLSKQNAQKRLAIETDCPQALAIINGYNWEAAPTNFDAMISSDDDKNIFLNEKLGDKLIVLCGPKRTIKVRADMLSVMFITAKKSSWQGGNKLYDANGRILKFPGRAVSIDKENAAKLSASLKQQLLRIDNSDPVMNTFKDTILFFGEGSFQIRPER